MYKKINLKTDNLSKIGTTDDRMVSYNIEMTEITGGTFWKSYSQNQIDGKESFDFSGVISDFTQAKDLTQYYPPINLYNETLRQRARALGKCFIRVSGSWATKTYYDFAGETSGSIPKGYSSVLTKEQWIGVLDFVRSVGGKLLISVSNCEGDHPNGGELDLTQTKKIFDFSHKYGVDIDAAEFMNEPNMLELSGSPKGYTAANYVRDADIFYGWARKNYPECLLVGPCSTGGIEYGSSEDFSNIGIKLCTDEELLKNAKIPLDVLSYHYYNGISERLASVLPNAHWDASEAHTDTYLDVAYKKAKTYKALRDKYVPNGKIWVTESGDAVCGGNTWASTYLDVLRTLNELGSFSLVTDGIIFHNTLASSDNGFLKHEAFEPRPNYFAVLLWNTLMGETVYRTDLSSDNLHIYCHSRKDNRNGAAYLIINNSLENSVGVVTPHGAYAYVLSPKENMRSTVMCLNGRPLTFDRSGNSPDMKGEYIEDEIKIAPGNCAFIICESDK